jgi:hypothetical protein
VRFINHSDRANSVHLHGSPSRSPWDGWADDVTQVNQYKDYYYPNANNARTLWYHGKYIANFSCAFTPLLKHNTQIMLSIILPKTFTSVKLVTMYVDSFFENETPLMLSEDSSRPGRARFWSSVWSIRRSHLHLSSTIQCQWLVVGSRTQQRGNKCIR